MKLSKMRLSYRNGGRAPNPRKKRKLLKGTWRVAVERELGLDCVIIGLAPRACLSPISGLVQCLARVAHGAE